MIASPCANIPITSWTYNASESLSYAMIPVAPDVPPVTLSTATAVPVCEL